jgi:phosphate transport system substrate-binding protein
MWNRRGGLLVALLVVTLPVSAIAQQSVELTGAGATFPYPLYSKWFDVYGREKGVRINYQPIGSGGGIRQISERTVDFGASDGPVPDDVLAKLAPRKLVHIPMVAGAVALAYHLQGIPSGLKLTPDVLADIYLGKLTRWNDPRLTALNRNLRFPDAAIVVAHRSDGSGTTNIFTDYLSKVSPEWKTRVGEGTSVEWPTGVGGKGNDGVTAIVKQQAGGIGYVELAYALQNRLTTAQMRNKAGVFISPSLSTTTAAVDAYAKQIPGDFRFFITDAPSKLAYPIAGFTWILLDQEQTNQAKGQALAQFLWWAIHDGQRYAPPLLYAPLPKALISRVEHTLRSVTFNGKPLLASGL